MLNKLTDIETIIKANSDYASFNKGEQAVDAVTHGREKFRGQVLAVTRLSYLSKSFL